MLRYLALAIVLAGLWVLLSGHFSALLLTFGAVSVAISVWLTHHLHPVDDVSHPFEHLFKLLGFWIKLGGKIFHANIDVCARILGFKPVTPHIVQINIEKMNELEKVTYANAITLTPGSASLHIQNNALWVHTISKEGAQAILDDEIGEIMPDLPVRGDQ